MYHKLDALLRVPRQSLYIVLRSALYVFTIAIKLSVLHLKWYEIHLNQCACVGVLE